MKRGEGGGTAGAGVSFSAVPLVCCSPAGQTRFKFHC